MRVERCSRSDPECCAVDETGEARSIARGNPSIQIALATFNSALFLRELLDSLLGQTFPDFTILVSDDGSTDGTQALIAEYQEGHPGRIETLPGAPPGGPMQNFSRIVGAASADYLFFCDHDDVWLPDKVAVTLRQMQALEALHGRTMPLLVHTDLIVVGPNLAVRSPSMAKDRSAVSEMNGLGALLVNNSVTGCTTMVNRALYRRAWPVPEAASMHDSWLALVAAAVGRLHYINRPTILYRQHGGNFLGAPPRGGMWFIRRVLQALFQSKQGLRLERLSEQAEALLLRYAADMSPAQREATAALANLWSVNRWNRFRLLRRAGVRRWGPVRTIAFYIAVTKHRPRRRAALLEAAQTHD